MFVGGGPSEDAARAQRQRMQVAKMMITAIPRTKR
jgi:hypothetical protein